ncbi:16S rRNA (uracil(1498)-N(3))-methyltransferase [Streptococcus sp. H49]|uniref:16S rRNA (uracil(1498)-N(3))-methyltransferase n=1 Tax=Streptococcus huangxiaojuni TaxID=3237239 RepID=UPI0034A4CC40
MQQYFVSGKAEHFVTIKDEASIKHMFSVMRLQDNDKAVLVFDDKVKRLARVADRLTHTFEILEELPDNAELPVDVTIASGFLKGDKLEFLVQKTSELGVHTVWGFPADYSVVKWVGTKLAKKTDKLNKIARGAAEQSKRNRIPTVKLFEKKKDFLSSLSGFDRIFIAYEEAAKAGENSALAQELALLSKGCKILFIFGPEGGISPSELAALESNGGLKVGLGPRIMRAETAPLFALSSVAYVFELMS